MHPNLLLLLPLLIPLYGAIACLLCWRWIKLQTAVTAASQLAWTAAAGMLLYHVLGQGVLATQIGNWPAPFGITLVADIFGALMVLTGTVTGLAVFLFSLPGLDRARKRYGYYPLLLFLQMGVSGVCLTGDIFNLYVWFEVLLICCFALLSLGSTRGQLEGAIKYVTINFLASGLLLTGVGVLYSLFGALNLAALAQMVQEANHPNLSLLPIAGVFFIVGFGIKAAVFPMFFWLPASYHTPPIAVSAFIGGLITKVGIYTLVRLFTTVFVVSLSFALPLFLVLAGLTMVIGVIGAAAQIDFRKILSFHIISQIGYMLMGLALYTPLALAGTIFFTLHNVLVKTNLFLISGVVAQAEGTFALKKLGGLYLRRPFLALLFFLSALSLAGIPPLSGFWGKLMLAKAGFASGNYLIAGTSLAVSLVTLFSMTKIWNEVFWKKKKKPAPPVKKTSTDVLRQRLLYLPVIFLMLFILLMGLYAAPVLMLAETAAAQLLHSETYIKAVLK
ncbi:multisubunit sodium/proton antiporter MrpD subunit [Pontibacter ummariensis]|uniref:Multisubunit sodium/proton antiporter, MrpD subunit n=1 Tax=Pontibacter ummariensis TaxID=1610492 RepID=A0A239BWE2_9BACT|nr:proton-conducting transporter membrane subunit [Pontibacter ummariensis]PRY15592.1 multisubunit sodium/proton antiporter MrpD subunit [Pontibacter ummariensis]SNS11979.1 multisubunit sodium/proton antiporter, MrpD subunit [Pontibacter ummariensis]